MIDESPVEREEAPGYGRYVIRLPGGQEAEMTYRRVGAGVIAIDHTYTPSAFRGNNIAFRMMQRAIDDARREGTKIRPECSYAVVQFRRHPEWAELLAQ
jgi:predicted GNAT family acetyltransferase